MKTLKLVSIALTFSQPFSMALAQSPYAPSAVSQLPPIAQYHPMQPLPPPLPTSPAPAPAAPAQVMPAAGLPSAAPESPQDSGAAPDANLDPSVPPVDVPAYPPAIQTPAVPHAPMQDNLFAAGFVRDLRTDKSFGMPTQVDWNQLLSELHQKADEGDARAAAALSYAPPYLMFQHKLANQPEWSNSDALTIYQLGAPLLLAKLPEDRAPLSDLEALSISIYTGTVYGPVTMDLGSYWGPKKFKTYVKVLDSALSRLPTYNGTVFHVEQMTVADLAQFPLGKVLTYGCYISTSAEKIGWDGNVRWIIHSLSGRLVEKYSVNPQEHEVLLPRGVKLKVMSLPKLVNGVYEINFEEIPGKK